MALWCKKTPANQRLDLQSTETGWIPHAYVRNDDPFHRLVGKPSFRAYSREIQRLMRGTQLGGSLMGTFGMTVWHVASVLEICAKEFSTSMVWRRRGRRLFPGRLVVPGARRTGG